MSNQYVRTGIAAKMLGQSKNKIVKLFKSGKLTGYIETTNEQARTVIYMISVESINHYISERTPQAVK